MWNNLKNLDHFTKNILIVFAGNSLGNFLNLLYQLLIAHKLSASEFGAFNSLVSIFIVLSAPLGTLQIAVAKYSAEFNALHQIDKLKFLLSDLLKKAFLLAGLTFLVFFLVLAHLIKLLKIPSLFSGNILAALIAMSWLVPILSGAIQGLEFFGWLTSMTVFTAILKLALAFLLIILGFKIAGALGAWLVSSIVGVVISYFALRRFIKFGPIPDKTEYKKMFAYLLPVALSYFCFMNLVNSDMVLVKYFFLKEDAGLYSLAQMVGKIFLFLPLAVSVVMFPKACGLNAQKKDTSWTLKKSLFYVFILCLLAVTFYNLFPAFVLKVLFGKTYPEAIFLGRLFSISMSFFTLSYLIISYFLSINDLRFIKYLVASMLLQTLAIVGFHQSLAVIQLTLCINSILLFLVHLVLVFKPGIDRARLIVAAG